MSLRTSKWLGIGCLVSWVLAFGCLVAAVLLGDSAWAPELLVVAAFALTIGPTIILQTVNVLDPQRRRSG